MDLILNVLLLFSLITSAFTQVPSSGCNLITIESKCFSYFNHSGINWNDARANCQTWGGDLASIAIAAENTAVDSIRSSSRARSCWIGLNDIGTEGTFVWSDGSNSSYRNWTGGAPNNGGNENCAYVELITWNAIPCNGSFNESCYYCSLLNVNVFGRIVYSSTFEGLNNNTILALDTTLYCVTENRNTPQVNWSYVDPVGIRSSLTVATNVTTGVSILELTNNNNPGTYSCQVTRNGAIVTYIAEIFGRSGCDLITSEGKCFSHFVNSGIYRSDAQASCQVWGGDLASIASGTENIAMQPLANPRASHRNCWIGLSDIDTDGVYVWSDGSNSSYRNWDENSIDQACIAYDTYYMSWADWNCAYATLTCYYCSNIFLTLFGKIESGFESLISHEHLFQDTNSVLHYRE